MADVKWIKLDKDIFQNRKIRQIEKMPDGDTLVVIWLKILTLAGSVNDGGLVYFTPDLPYTEELLAVEFDRPVTTVRLALEVFQQFGMIEIVDNVIMVSNWAKYQNIEGLEKLQEQNRNRQSRFRARKKDLLTEGNVTRNVTDNVTVTQSNETDIDKELDIRDKSNRGFKPPSLEEVQAYCKERNNHVDAERFIDFYESKGWMVGKNKMKNWKACVRTWEQRDKGSKTRLQDRHDYDYDEIEERLFGDD